ncbi:MAG: T9SS type A sorting domain-containing protein [Flavobacteriales bacterium]|nr:T9SS type A sorting domain-containing protein [Flavobacteriales bacterium]
MKTPLLLLSLSTIISFSAIGQEINPIRMGQFFEQGYGRGADDWSNDESALDIIATPTGIAMAGWMSSESHGLRMALWHVNEYGALSLFGEYGNDQTHQIAASLALSSTGQSLLVGRQTDTYSDEYRSTLNTGDLALIKYIDTDGGELWSVLLDSTDTDTSEVAVDVFNAGNNEFVILINRLYSENNNQDFRVIKMESNSNVLWDKKYSFTYSGSKQNVFAEKIIDRGNGFYLVQANDVYNKHVLICEINANDGSYQTHQNYPQTNPTLGFGVSQNLSTGGYIVVGSEEDGPELDGFILEINPDLSEYGGHTIVNGSSGNEHFKDIITHPTGYLAIGECDNRGEGQRDVWICHLDSLADTLKVETLGGEETDYGHAAVLVPSVFSVFIAGYNNSYTIEESGNAYLGGVKVDMGLPKVEQECKVSRVLFIDGFVVTKQDNSGIIDSTKGRLGKPADETNIIQFAKDNYIGVLELYGVDHIFRQVNNTTLGKHYRKLLNDFIYRCKKEHIHCSMISGYKELPYDSAREFNKHVAASKYGYNSEGKLSYNMIEHEFWNARKTTSSKNNNVDNSQAGKDTIILPLNYTWNDHYLDCLKDHIDILNELRDKKFKDANIHEIHDYYGYFCNYTWNSSANLNGIANTSWRDSIAGVLEPLSDGMFLTYYRPFQFDSGAVFLGGTSGFEHLWTQRLSYLGQNPNDSTQIFPLFSAEFFNTSSDFCGAGDDFLGRYLEGFPANGPIGNDLRKVEGIYLNQHNTIYQNTSSYPNIGKVQVNATSWFTYKCIDQKNFTDKSRHNCHPFTRNPLKFPEIQFKKHSSLVYPNPSNSVVNIQLNQIQKGEYRLYSNTGSLVREGVFDTREFSLHIENLQKGLYHLTLHSNGTTYSHKIVVSK